MSVLADEACSHFGASLDRKAATDSELSFSDVYPPSWLTRVESTDPLDRPPLSRPAAVAESAGSAIAKGDMNGFRNSLKQALEYARGNNELFDEFKSTLAEAVKKNGYTVKLNDRVNPIENDQTISIHKDGTSKAIEVRASIGHDGLPRIRTKIYDRTKADLKDSTQSALKEMRRPGLSLSGC